MLCLKVLRIRLKRHSIKLRQKLLLPNHSGKPICLLVTCQPKLMPLLRNIHLLSQDFLCLFKYWKTHAYIISCKILNSSYNYFLTNSFAWRTLIFPTYLSSVPTEIQNSESLYQELGAKDSQTVESLSGLPFLQPNNWMKSYGNSDAT